MWDPSQSQALPHVLSYNLLILGALFPPHPRRIHVGSSFGSASMLITLIKIFSTLWIGDQRSEACSY
jgi:hypothetical protein